MTKIQSPRGTSDILPDQVLAWEAFEAAARTLLKTYAYREIRTPLFEDVGLFKRSLGEMTEVVNKQLLEVRSQREDTEEEAGFALRPEGTAPVVRAYNQYDLGREEYLSKLFYIGPMFRGERPQKGRLRQFHQIGVEAIGRGASHPLLDVEMIVLAVGLLKAFGLDKFKLRINSLGSAEDKQAFAAWLRDALKGKISHLSEECQKQYERNVFRLLDSKDEACQEVVRKLSIGTSHLSESGLAYFEEVKKGLDQLHIAYEVSSQLVRGLDYYTHTVFEISYDGLGAQDAIGAGGRYNGLIEQLGGGDRRFPEEIGAIGFALGMERILLALEHQHKVPHLSYALDAFVVCGDAELKLEAFALLEELRREGCSADMDFGNDRPFKKQFEQAHKANAAFALVLGPEEFRGRTVGIKNMATGEQESVGRDRVVEELKKRLIPEFSSE